MAVTHGGVSGLLSVLVGDGGVHVDETQEVEAEGRSQATEQPGTEAANCKLNGSLSLFLYSLLLSHSLSLKHTRTAYIHAAELQAVGISLVGYEVVVVKHSEAEHGGVDTHTHRKKMVAKHAIWWTNEVTKTTKEADQLRD